MTDEELLRELEARLQRPSNGSTSSGAQASQTGIQRRTECTVAVLVATHCHCCLSYARVLCKHALTSCCASSVQNIAAASLLDAWPPWCSCTGGRYPFEQFRKPSMASAIGHLGGPSYKLMNILSKSVFLRHQPPPPLTMGRYPTVSTRQLRTAKKAAFTEHSAACCHVSGAVCEPRRRAGRWPRRVASRRTNNAASEYVVW